MLDGSAGAGPGGGGSGRDAGGGGAALRGRALDRVALGYGRPRGGAARGEKDGRRPEAENHGRGGGRAPRPARGGEPPDLGGVPRPAGGADRRAGAPVDRGEGPATARLDVKGADVARGRAGVKRRRALTLGRHEERIRASSTPG